MASININGTSIYYEVYGEGKETLLFSHGLLWSGKMFHPQVDYFKKRFKVVVYDHCGQGRSEGRASGYDMDSLTEDTVSLIEQLELGPCHVAGLSMGGFVAMRLASRRPELVKSLILLETSAEPEVYKFKYNLLNTVVRLFGVKAVTNQVMPIMFGQTFLNDVSRTDEKQQWTKELQNNQKSIVKAVKGVIDREGIIDELRNITMPTLILVGDEDVATPPDKAKTIHEYIAGSELKIIKGAGHTSCIEEPKQVNEAIEKFLNRLVQH